MFSICEPARFQGKGKGKIVGLFRIIEDDICDIPECWYTPGEEEK